VKFEVGSVFKETIVHRYSCVCTVQGVLHCTPLRCYQRSECKYRIVFVQSRIDLAVVVGAISEFRVSD
jgi:hypothetical protein